MRCDCHVHVVDPIGQGAQVPQRTYLAAPAPLETLVRLGGTRGIDRFVIVQPSFYGDDNSVLLKALADLNGSGRGVAVLRAGSAHSLDLAALRRQGVRGLRVNLYSPAAGRDHQPLSGLFGQTAALAESMQWHVEIIAPLRVLVDNESEIRRSPVAVVIDHYGLYGNARPTSLEGQRLLDLVGADHIWMKLSAPYRHDKGPLAVEPDTEWLRALLSVAPDRCVWGSDWPHPPSHDTHTGPDVITAYRKIAYGTLVDRFVDAVGSPSMTDAVFGANAARLYEF
jgi:predicted TIM-barrel fold metal-dependent hydrolase